VLRCVFVNVSILLGRADVWVMQDGDYVEVRSRHGECELPIKIGKIGKGQVFVPMHFGSVVDNCEGGRASTANELTQPTWDR
jgi:ferredoxin-nitrate reductase